MTVMLMSVMPALASAQRAPAPITPTAPVQARDSVVIKRPSPRNALLKSLIVPGWGQFSVHAYKRGTFFVAAQSASWYMLLKTINKLNDAKDSHGARVATASDSLRALMSQDSVLARQLSDPIKFDERVKSDPNVQHAQGLVDARKEQRQDWIAYTLALTFASGIDAYVAAQLADFPATIDAEPTPTGGVQLKVGVPLPRKK
jgi:hypothetical protein